MEGSNTQQVNVDRKLKYKRLIEEGTKVGEFL